MSLSRCPNEILCQIYSYLAFEQTRNLRETSRRLAVIGLDYLAHQVTILPSKWSKARLIEISLHPILNGNVKTIRFCPPINPRYYWVYSPHLAQNSPDGRADSNAHSTLADMVEECYIHPSLSQKAYLAFLKDILPTFPNLQHVLIDTRIPPDIFPGWCKPPTKVNWDDVYRDYPFEHAESSDLWAEHLAPLTLDAVLSTVANFTGQKTKQQFSLDYHCLPFGIDDFPQWHEGIQRLTRLSLGGERFSSYWNDDAPAPRFDVADLLVGFVKAAPKLEELSIEVGEWEDSDTIIGKDFVWTHLKRLSLRSHVFDRALTVDFFKRHNKSLKHLCLDYVKLEDADSACDWVDFLESIFREARIRLETLQLFNIFSDIRALQLISPTHWESDYPHVIPPWRTIRYLMCGKKTDMEGEKDGFSSDRFDWNIITWDSIREDIDTIHRHRVQWEASNRYEGL